MNETTIGKFFINNKSGKVYTCIGMHNDEKHFIFDKANIKFDPYTIERIICQEGDSFYNNFTPLEIRRGK
jgi:N-acetylglutamate synthase-like GNAT family acetyltransferase